MTESVRHWFLFLLLQSLWSVTAAIGTYTVVAPKILRPGLNYQFSVSIHDTREPVRVSVSLLGRAVTGGLNEQATEAVINSGETQVIKFEIGDWGPGKYNLTVSGAGGLRFTNTTELEYQQKSYSVFIQTDKAIYQPSQTVHFRAIIVNPMLKPTVAGAIEVFIIDGQGNRVKQWKRVFTSKGVFSGELKLSDQPVLGNWNITVVASDQQYSKSFTVAEYVLPTYEVSVQLPSYAIFNDSKVVATVTAKYTYGKPVRGNVTLVMSPRVHSPVIQVWLIPPVRKIAEIDGIANIELDLKDLKLQEDYQRDIIVEAIVKEALTGQRQNASAVLSLFRYRVKLELIKTAETFKPGLKYTAYLKVAYQDDVPIRDNANPVKVKFGYNYNESTYQVREYQIPRDGVIQLDFYPPHSPNVNVLVIKADYLDFQQIFPGIEQSTSPSRNYIQALLLTDNPRVGDEAVIEVNATEVLSSFVIQVYGRGNLALAQTIPVENEKSVRFKFTVTQRMSPKARLIVYYVRIDGEIVADALNFDVEGVFQTPVEVGVNVNQTLPGSQVEVHVNTKPEAFVGILGIDQKVLLLKSGNDITREDVLNELMTYDCGKTESFNDDFFSRYLWSPGAVTASQVFEDSGVVIITNGNVFQYYPRNGNTSTGRIVRPQESVSQQMRERTPQRTIFIPRRPQHRFIPHYSLPVVKPPENWLWSDSISGSDGSVVVARAAPDTITSWVISAFAIDSISGLGVARSPSKVTVFRPFFISLNLPYSIIRGEAVAIQIVVFNYMQKDVEAVVVLKNSGQFDFVTFESDANEISLPQKSKRVMVKSSDGALVSFMIQPKILGYVDIEVSAQASNAGDRVLKKLLVKPEGVTLNFNKAILVDLRKNPTFNRNVKVDIPQYAVPGSQRVEVTAIGDILGPAINNLDSLLRMPFGCGEQNMVYFVPNIVVAKYLERVNRLYDTIKQKIITHLETGYQRELTYKRSDGSYSAFGKQDKIGSTWLTAFVAKSFHQAKSYITIDDKVINGALKWLVSKQSNDGSFPEVGSVSHKAMQGGSANGAALTAYVLIAFLENGAHQMNEFNGGVEKAKRNLEQAIAVMNDNYALSIATYALHLIGSQEKENAYKKLAQRMKTKDDMKFLVGAELDDTSEMPGVHNQAKSFDIEMTSYALMTCVLRNDIENAISIMKWLISQTNANGGFSSTQDTVIGIQALANLAEQISAPLTGIDVTFTFKDITKTIPLNNDNAMILHRLQMLSDVREISISAKGGGFAIVQVSFSYNLNVTTEKPSFQVNPLVDRNSHRNLLVINACASYAKKGASNMAIMEIDLPSGYTVDKDSLPALLKVKDVKRVDTKDGDTGVVIYFDKLTSEEVCPTVKAFRTFKVAKQKPTSVIVSDYYDNLRSARSFYQSLPADLCDICEAEDCDRNKCPDMSENEVGSYTNSATRSTSPIIISVILTCATLFVALH